VAADHFDVLIVGAGLSGIGAACHLRASCPDKTFAILESRAAMGGTWDLFRYPGVRSDSDMFTLGYAFKPWTGAKSIVDGPTILRYIEETAREHDVERYIRYRTRVKRVSWSSDEAQWTVEVETGEAETPARFTCRFLMMCAGYYRYDAGYLPDFPGIDAYRGRIVHPQTWTDDIDFAGKRVLVIGSGATAVTLVPEMAKTAAHVTMLQRSPTYIVAMPNLDPIARGLRKALPQKLAYGLTRAKNVAIAMFYFKLARSYPDVMKARLLEAARAALGPDYDIATHLTPRYKPWDQRICLAPDGDFFDAISNGSASIVTDEIETFTPAGVKLRSGTEIEADIVVTATGLELVTMGGAAMSIDGAIVEPVRLISYKGVMLSNVPNYVNVFGYTNASWTLKADLIARYVCRLLNFMDRKNYDTVCPRIAESDIQRTPIVDFSSGYFARAQDRLPKQGTKEPWRAHQNYVLDVMTLRFGSLNDGVLQFSRRSMTGAEDEQTIAGKESARAA
jgi:monooxygenase